MKPSLFRNSSNTFILRYLAPDISSRTLMTRDCLGSRKINRLLARDLLYPSSEKEKKKKKHKKKQLVQSPHSYFMDVQGPGCYKITTVFNHAQMVFICAGCSTVLLCKPTEGKARLTGCSSLRRKQH
ncbi:small ribosomal subunit protein eS27-like [Mustela lutreola]|uniref:small ribosomal subunit protein eS27-like n=1 Tax=Mustela lutreola TaxID=9666 RepID=UPI0027970110|nr:small ribosomal subunit protein eS27-like [Mustela lutreola]